MCPSFYSEKTLFWFKLQMVFWCKAYFVKLVPKWVPFNLCITLLALRIAPACLLFVLRLAWFGLDLQLLLVF